MYHVFWDNSSCRTSQVNSDEAKQNYPFAMTLQEAGGVGQSRDFCIFRSSMVIQAARTYMQTCAQIKAAPPFATHHRQGTASLFRSSGPSTTDGLVSEGRTGDRELRTV